MNDEFLQWLREQLDDDEQTARKLHNLLARLQWTADRALGLQSAIEWNVPRAEWARLMGALPSEPDGLTWVEAVEMRGTALDPARVLREVEAKRGVLRQYLDLREQVRNPVSAENRARARALQGELGDVLRLLALPYADRPGYRDEWRP